MVRFALKNDFAKAQALHYKLLPAYDLLFVENNPAGVKAFLYELKLIENELRLPLVPLSSTFHEKVKNFLSTVS
jgi:4-hydroxy-tetrahydrodipicolinate synthase